MKKQLHILEGFIILTIIFIAILFCIKFIYKINNEKIDTSYMWNIKFTNLKTKENNIKGDIALKDNQLTLKAIFKEEQEVYEFSFDIENNGTLDAILKDYQLNLNNPDNILVYKILYSDNTKINENDILESNSKKTIVVKIEYPKQKEHIYKEFKLDLSIKFTYKAI